MIPPSPKNLLVFYSSMFGITVGTAFYSFVGRAPWWVTCYDSALAVWFAWCLWFNYRRVA